MDGKYLCLHQGRVPAAQNGDIFMNSKDLKQKIRKLKKLELMYRYGFSPDYIKNNMDSERFNKLPLVWKDFFKERYSLSTLERMDENQMKQVTDEFWFWVFYRAYQEKGLDMLQVQNPELLDYLGLPYDSDEKAVRKKFHELCRKFHPDEGGCQEKFIELMSMMDKYNVP
jgi:hypothetical protein